MLTKFIVLFVSSLLFVAVPTPSTQPVDDCCGAKCAQCDKCKGECCKDCKYKDCCKDGKCEPGKCKDCCKDGKCCDGCSDACKKCCGSGGCCGK